MSNQVKERLLRSTILAGFAAMSVSGAQAFAQENVISTDDEEREEEARPSAQDRITVTGSRITRSEFTSISPIQVISGEISRDLGLVNADEVLNQLTVVQGQQTDLGVSTVIQPTQAFTTFGSVTPSLRGLGSSITGRSRTLVMINSRRYGPIGVGGAPANPDVSLIPGSMIQRVDVLLDGASSIYGSDAIAGVINYILRDNIEGLEVDAFHSFNEIGHGPQTVLSAVAGISNDRGRIQMAFEYNKQDPVTRFDRRSLNGAAESGLFCDPLIEVNDITGESFRGCGNFLAGFATFGPLGTVFPTPGTTNIGIPGFSNLANPPFNDPRTFGGQNDPYARSHPQDQFATVVPETERFTVFANGEYDIDLYTAPQFYFEFSYSERNLEALEFNQLVLEVVDDTPFNPGLGSTLIVGTLANETAQNINVLRGVAGVRGDLPFLDGLFHPSFGNWSYDLSALFHRSRGTQRRFGAPIRDNVSRVLNGTTDPVTGVFTCALPSDIGTPTRAGPGGGFAGSTSPTECFAVNFFDPTFWMTGRFSDPAANDFILGEGIQNTRVDQLTYQGFLSGDLFTIPTGGPVSAAFGFEYRRDIVETINDALTATPNSFFGQNTDLGSNGRRYLWEGFGEVTIPLVQGRTLIENLQIDAATRYTEEQFFGSEWTHQIKGEYAPTNWLSFSAGYGTSFRAPDTGEQFGTGTAFAINTRADPCLPSTNVLQTDPDTGLIFYDASRDDRQQSVIDLCTQLGVMLPTGPNDAAGAARVGIFGIGTPSGSFQNFSVLLSNAGSTDVGPETSEAIFLKATFTQPWFDSFNFNFSANYFEYEVSDSIGQLTQGLILSTCFNDPNAQVVNGVIMGDLCQFQSRDPNSGLLNAVNEASFNLGSITSRGIDFNAIFSMDLVDLPQIGHLFAPMDDPISININYRGTWQLEAAEDVTGNGIFTNNLGNFGFPEWQMNLTTQLRWRDFSLLHRVRYSDPVDSRVSGGGGTFCAPELTARGEPQNVVSACRALLEFPALHEHDLTATYAHNTWVVRLGVRNLFDKVVVRDFRVPNDGNTGTPFGAGFSLNGRSFFVNVSKSF